MAPIMGRGRYGVAETVGTYARPHPMPIGKSAYRKPQAVSEPSRIHPTEPFAIGLRACDFAWLFSRYTPRPVRSNQP